MKAGRTETLLLAIAADLERGASPLNPVFLQEHGVTFDECLELSDTMAMVLRGYVRLPQRTVLMVRAAAAAKDDAEAESLVASVEATHARRRLIEALGKPMAVSCGSADAPTAVDNLPPTTA